MPGNTCNWTESPVFPSEYLVSDDGRVYSRRSKKELNPNTDKYGYLYYVLCVNGIRKTVKAHRLVAMAFLPNHDEKPSVDHKNGIRSDNRVANLKWATYKENINNPQTKPNHIASALSRIPKMYEKSKERGFGRKGVHVVFRDGTEKNYESLKAAAIATGKNYAKLSEILNGKRKQDKQFTALWASEIDGGVGK